MLATLVAAGVTVAAHRLRLATATAGAAWSPPSPGCRLTGYALDRTFTHDAAGRALWGGLEVWPLLAAAALVAAPGLAARACPRPARVAAAAVGRAAAGRRRARPGPAPRSPPRRTLVAARAAGGRRRVVTWLLPRPWGLTGSATQAVAATAVLLVGVVLAQPATAVAPAGRRPRDPVWSGGAGDRLPPLDGLARPAGRAGCCRSQCWSCSAPLAVSPRRAARRPGARRGRPAPGRRRGAAGRLAVVAAWRSTRWRCGWSSAALLLAAAVRGGSGGGAPTTSCALAARGRCRGGRPQVSAARRPADRGRPGRRCSLLTAAGAPARPRGIARRRGRRAARPRCAGPVWTAWATSLDAEPAWVALAGLLAARRAGARRRRTPRGAVVGRRPAVAWPHRLEAGAAAAALPLAAAGVLLAPAGGRRRPGPRCYLTVGRRRGDADVAAARGPARAGLGRRRAAGAGQLGAAVGPRRRTPRRPTRCRRRSALLVVGLVHLRRDPAPSTMTALAPGLSLALVPSLLWVLDRAHRPAGAAARPGLPRAGAGRRPAALDRAARAGRDGRCAAGAPAGGAVRRGRGAALGADRRRRARC